MTGIAIGCGVGPYPTNTHWFAHLAQDAPLLIDRGTMVGATGAACASMHDAITGAVVATAAGAAQPTLTADGADFDGAANTMSLTYTNASHAYTFVAVVTPDTVSGTQQILGAFGASVGVFSALSGNVAANDSTASRAGMVATARKQLLMVTVNPAGSLVSFYRDGQLLATATYDDTWAWGATPKIGASHNGANFLDGKIHCLAIIPSVLSAARRAVWTSTLMARYGLAFSPLSVANCEFWYTIAEAYMTLSGSNVTQLTDRSGNARHATVPGGVNAPAWNSAASTLDFDAANSECLQKSTWTRVQPYTNVADIKISATATAFTRAWDGTTGNTGGLLVWTASRPSIYAGTELNHPSADPTAFTRYACIYNGVSSSISADGGAATTGNAGASNPGGLTIGAYGDASSNYMDGSYRGHFMGYSRALAALELTALDTYLQ